LSIASDYLNRIKAIVLEYSWVHGIKIIQERAFGDLGMLRIKLNLLDNSQLEMFEYFSVEEGQYQVKKYSFHWQKSSGDLIRRWDNAAHHPEIENFPHHVHVGENQNILPGEAMNIKKVLLIIGKELDLDEKR